MGRSAIGLGALMGGTLGGYLPVLWGAGASSFRLASLVFGALGAATGVVLAARLADVWSETAIAAARRTPRR